MATLEEKLDITTATQTQYQYAAGQMTIADLRVLLMNIHELRQFQKRYYKQSDIKLKHELLIQCKFREKEIDKFLESRDLR